MQEAHLKYLACPECESSFSLRGHIVRDGKHVVSGDLVCEGCGATYPIAGAIPRFVPLDNYADSFGFEWLKHARTQYDEYSGVDRSKQRFRAETRFPACLDGETILEVGSGSGRFTSIAAETGAMVCSLDYSRAVEANFESNGSKENVLIVQGDLYCMPFRRNMFDRLFCLGVLQHTPNVKRSFFALLPFLKPGGTLAIDCYAQMKGALPFIIRNTSTKVIARLFTPYMDKSKLYRWCERHTNRMWPLAKKISKIPHIGATLNRRLLVVYYGNDIPDMREEKLREWGVLDLFDMLSPMYDKPQHIETIQEWFHEAGLEDIDVQYGYNGINGRGRKSLH